MVLDIRINYQLRTGYHLNVYQWSLAWVYHHGNAVYHHGDTVVYTSMICFLNNNNIDIFVWYHWHSIFPLTP